MKRFQGNSDREKLFRTIAAAFASSDLNKMSCRERCGYGIGRTLWRQVGAVNEKMLRRDLSFMDLGKHERTSKKDTVSKLCEEAYDRCSTSMKYSHTGSRVLNMSDRQVYKTFIQQNENELKEIEGVQTVSRSLFRKFRQKRHRPAQKTPMFNSCPPHTLGHSTLSGFKAFLL